MRGLDWFKSKISSLLTYWGLAQSFYPEVRSVAKEAWLFSISSPEPCLLSWPSGLAIHTTSPGLLCSLVLVLSRFGQRKILAGELRAERETERQREVFLFLPPFCFGVLYLQVQFLWGGPSSSKHLCCPCPLRPTNGNSFSLLLVPGYLNILAGSLILVNTPFTKTSSNERFWMGSSVSYSDSWSCKNFFFKKEAMNYRASQVPPLPDLMLLPFFSFPESDGVWCMYLLWGRKSIQS